MPSAPSATWAPLPVVSWRRSLPSGSRAICTSNCSAGLSAAAPSSVFCTSTGAVATALKYCVPLTLADAVPPPSLPSDMRSRLPSFSLPSVPITTVRPGRSRSPWKSTQRAAGPLPPTTPGIWGGRTTAASRASIMDEPRDTQRREGPRRDAQDPCELRGAEELRALLGHVLVAAVHAGRQRGGAGFREQALGARTVGAVGVDREQHGPRREQVLVLLLHHVAGARADEQPDHAARARAEQRADRAAREHAGVEQRADRGTREQRAEPADGDADDRTA